jgi:hypothetical protein
VVLRSWGGNRSNFNWLTCREVDGHKVFVMIVTVLLVAQLTAAWVTLTSVAHAVAGHKDD